MLLALYGAIYLAMYGWSIFVAVDLIEVVQFLHSLSFESQ